MQASDLTLEQLLDKVQQLRAEGALPSTLTREEKVSFAYGNVRLSNPNVTREMVEQAYDRMQVQEDKTVSGLLSAPIQEIGKEHVDDLDYDEQDFEDT